jgi:phage repressor protein C with HTH and peptisase S24 domain
MGDDRDISTGFADRLAAAMGREPQAVVAKRAQISTSVLSKYLQGSEPGLMKAARLARATGVSLQWLATGEGAPNAGAGGYVGIPIYDVRLAAGVASFSEAAQVIGEMPFDLDLLRQLGRATADGLGVLESSGDSMEPLIPDGARVLIDFKDTRLRERIFGFRFGDELRIKRLRRTLDGVEILSENPRYEPELLTGEQLEHFGIIGRAIWAGAVL